MQRSTYKQLDDKVAWKIDQTAPRTAWSILSADLNTKACKKNKTRKSTANTNFVDANGQQFLMRPVNTGQNLLI